jgi:exopolysaccharide biosynthesis polyprenyl glycosylphosphotransferase
VSADPVWVTAHGAEPSPETWVTQREEPAAETVTNLSRRRPAVAPIPPRVSLRGIFVATDAFAIACAWLAVSLLMHRWNISGLGIQAGRLAAVTATGVLILALGGLGPSLVAPIRSVELVRLGRMALGTAVAAYVVGLVSRGQRREAVIGAVTCYVLLALSRRVFAGWLRSRRQRGRYLDPVVVVGNDAEAASVAARLQSHPEFGCRVLGLVADRAPALVSQEKIPLLGPPAATLDIVRQSGATGTIMSAGGLSPALRNRLLRQLMAEGVYVQMSTGLSGICHTRLRAMPVGHEAYFGVEQIALGRTQLMAKRVLDIVIAPLMMLVTLPIMIAAAAAIKIEDRGPIMFRQRRVGRNGQPFTVYKFRTMATDAEQRLAALKARNERVGPLFKVTDDPRVTRTGRLLRATSIDELPQLLNVVLGQMTLVGPRPALPDEVAQFDEELLGRHRMTPGITGMWQVEARDDPSFESYRMYDMFYVENWSLSLDLAIIFGTITSVIARGFRQLAGRRGEEQEDGGPSGPAEPEVRPVVLASHGRSVPSSLEPAAVGATSWSMGVE